MALGYLISPVLQFVDVNGKPLVGGYIVVYHAATTQIYITQKDGYGNKNPKHIVLDSLGMCTIIAEKDRAYDLYCYDKNGVQMWSRSNMEVGDDIIDDSGDSTVPESALVVITPNVKADGGLSLTSEGSAHITEKTGLSFELPFVQLKQEPWNNTSEKVGLSFELSYLNLYRDYEAMTTETDNVLTTENNESIDVLLK